MILANPEVAYRSCEDCRKWMYNHETGDLVMRNGEPVLRVKGVKLPCEMSVGQPFDVRQRACAKVAPDAGLELSEKNLQAYQHYRECKAVGEFPDDPIVRQNAATISEIIENHKELRQLKFLGLMRR